MNFYKLPGYVLTIIARLKESGFEAYAVGGCVRDIVLGIAPADYDIATSAKPTEVAELFERTVRTGEMHGTITVLIGDRQAEVTTFRTESGYSDHRRPDSVVFVSELREDLSRRDFTINSLAMDADGAVIDCFGGVSDIKNGIIRCVGEPEKRFTEDALRMLRALRFSAVLGFEIDCETLAAIKKCSHLSARLSAERVQTEFFKILLSPRPETMENVIGLGLLNSFLSPKPIDLYPLSRIPADEKARLALFSYLLKQNGLIISVDGFLKDLRFSRVLVSACKAVASILESEYPETAADMKRLIVRYGYDAAACAASVSPDDGFRRLFDSVMSSGECFCLGQLAVNGDDLRALGYSGKSVGTMLSSLLEHVIDAPSENDRNILLNIAKKQF